MCVGRVGVAGGDTGTLILRSVVPAAQLIIEKLNISCGKAHHWMLKPQLIDYLLCLFMLFFLPGFSYLYLESSNSFFSAHFKMLPPLSLHSPCPLWRMNCSPTWCLHKALSVHLFNNMCCGWLISPILRVFSSRLE